MSKGMTREWGRPAQGPWWRFVPWSQAMGYVTAVVGFALLAEALSSLLTGGDRNSGLGVAVEVVLAVVSVVLIVQSVDGLRILRDRRARRRSS